ncbi:MAG: aminoacyl-tRNA hydrolase [Polyangiales bacterium]
MKLLVGLGNPGPQYARHRHNVGFMVADRLHARAYGSEWREKHVGLAARAVIAGHEVTLLKPQTFMNLSGRSVVRALQQMGLGIQDVLVVHDELELPFGELRAKQGGGHGGHNGLRDIAATAGVDFARVRVGIGRPAVGAVDAYVLSAFSKDEAPLVDGLLDRAADLCEAILAQGVEAVLAKAAPAKKAARPPRG